MNEFTAALSNFQSAQRLEKEREKDCIGRSHQVASVSTVAACLLSNTGLFLYPYRLASLWMPFSVVYSGFQKRGGSQFCYPPLEFGSRFLPQVNLIWSIFALKSDIWRQQFLMILLAIDWPNFIFKQLMQKNCTISKRNYFPVPLPSPICWTCDICCLSVYKVQNLKPSFIPETPRVL